MLSFLNRGERVAVVFLCVSLLVGGIVSLVEHLSPSTIDGFQVVRGALAAPDSVTVPDSLATVRSAGAAAEGKEKGKSISSRKEAPRGKLNLNTAPASELEGLPRIGPKMAQRIVEFRREHGAFRRIEDITKVKGVGPKTFQLLRPHIEITPPDSSR